MPRIASRRGFRAGLSTLTVVALAAATLITAPLAANAAATPSVTVSQNTDLNPLGQTITVTGSGFTPNSPTTDGTSPPLAGKFGGVFVAFGSFLPTWKPSAGADSAARAVAPGQVRWVVDAADVATIGGAPAGAVAINPDGSFSIELTVSAEFAGYLADGNYGVYTYPGSGAANPAFETATPLTFASGDPSPEPAPDPDPEPEPAPTVPTVTVSERDGLNGAGQTVTVSGTGFVPNAPATNAMRPPLAPRGPGAAPVFGGVFVAFGSFLDTWKPSEGAPSSARQTAPGQVKWVVNPESVAIVGGAAAGGVAINADGSFEVELTVSEEFAGFLADGNYGIFTYAGGGAVNAAFETYTPVTFGAVPGPVPTTTTVLTANPGASTLGTAVSLTATVSPATAGTVAFFDGSTALGTATVALPGGTARLSTSSLTVGDRALRSVFTPADSSVAIGSTGTLAFTVSAPTVTSPASAGSLRWGVKESFRSYVTGPIARGSISASGVAATSNILVFTQTSAATGSASGTVSYSGSVRYLGHNGELDVTLASPAIVFTSATTAQLTVAANGSRLAIATLSLAGGARTDFADGSIRFAGVPAALTSAGTSVFSFQGSSFYPAGTALDPVTFTVGAPSTSGGGTQLVGTFVERVVPAAPPATSGAELVGDDAQQLLPGQQITVTAGGFQPDETGIQVVIYSDPQVLATSVTADSAGVATWTGRLPADLVGTHTLTLQGSVDRAIVIEIVDLVASASTIDGCVVSDAQLTWGFKEAFRAYVSGSIANGEWQALDGATYATPDFTFADGAGAVTALADDGEIVFAGGIRFTGHGGILDTTVATPRLVFVDDSTAILVVDVTGTTQQGDVVNQRDVEFLELDLAAAQRTVDNATVTLAEIPAVLTVDGSEAFGTYESGESFDPLTIEYSVGVDCVDAIADSETVNDSASAGENASTPWALIIGFIAALLAIIAVLVVVLVRRRATA